MYFKQHFYMAWLKLAFEPCYEKLDKEAFVGKFLKIPDRHIGKHQNQHYSLLPCLFNINIIILPSLHTSDEL